MATTDKTPQAPISAGTAATAPAGDTRQRLIRGIVMTLVGGTLWGMNGTVSKILMDTYAVDPLWLACVRELTSCWLFLLVAHHAHPGRVRKAISSPRAMGAIFVTAIASILLSQVAYLEAINWTNSATATVMQSLECVLVMGYVCLKSRRAPRRREVVGLVLAVVGVYLVATGGNVGVLALPVEGLFWGVMCAVAAAILAIQPVGIMNVWGNTTVNGLAFLMSGIVLSAFVQPWRGGPTLDAWGIALLVFIVVVGTFGAYGLFMQGVRRVGSLRGSLLAQSEPVVATITSILWCGVVFAPGSLVGMALIIVVVFLTA